MTWSRNKDIHIKSHGVMGHLTCYYTVKSDLGGSFTYSLTPISIGEFTWAGGPPAINFAQGPRWAWAGHGQTTNLGRWATTGRGLTITRTASYELDKDIVHILRGLSYHEFNGYCRNHEGWHIAAPPKAQLDQTHLWETRSYLWQINNEKTCPITPSSWRIVYFIIYTISRSNLLLVDDIPFWGAKNIWHHWKCYHQTTPYSMKRVLNYTLYFQWVLIYTTKGASFD